MIDYGVDIGNTNGVLGGYTAKNASGAGATDGTPYVAAFIDDIWGPKQALMDRASLTPNGVTESVAASQILDAMEKGYALGAGYIVQYEKAASPATNGDRVLLLTGQGVLIASYPELTTAVYVGDGNNATAATYYKADDAAGTIRNTAGTYLILPDYRGVVPRGLDVAAAIDPGGASRTLGSLQQDAYQGHHHQFYGSNVPYAGGTGNLYYGVKAANAGVAVDNSDGEGARESVTDGVNGTPRISSETRMYNIATTYGITY
jgi:hypothetical protein